MKGGVIANAILFQGNWFVVILSAAAGHPWVGLLSSAAFVLGYAGLTGRWAGVLRMVAACAAIGYVGDSVLVLTGAMGFPPEASLGAPSTLWMVALWAAIACTLHSCMGWLLGRPALAAIFGLIGGAGSYFAGSSLGAVTFPSGLSAGLLGAGGLWLVAMPLLAWLAPRLDPVASDGTDGAGREASPHRAGAPADAGAGT